MINTADFIPQPTDEENLRKSKLLNILLLILSTITILFLVAFIPASILTETFGTQTFQQAIAVAVVLLIGLSAIYLLNRKTQSVWLRVLFVGLLLMAFAASDSPDALIAGRSIIVWVIPILLASFTITPSASVYTTIVVTAIFVILGTTTTVRPNLPALITFYLLSFVSWLATRTVENAIDYARQTNAQLDQLVRERTAELRGILQSIGDGVLVYRSDIIISSNHTMQQMLDDKNLNGKRVEALPADFLNDINALRFGTPARVNVDTKFYSTKKTRLIVEGEGSAKAGEIVVFRDISDIVEAERMKDNFLSTVSHELRTPLNAIMGYVDMFNEGVFGDVTDSGQQAHRRILFNSKRMLTMVNNLLDQARATAGRLTVNMKPTPVKGIFDEVEGVTYVLADQKDLELAFTLDPTLPDEIVIDQHALSRILINLIGNAIKFTDEGHVKIDTKRTTGDQWRITVSDTGVGIPEDELPTIFEAFQMVHDPKTRRAQGTGLGLSITRELVNLMHGSISVESEYGTGTTFTLHFPIMQEQEVEPAAR